MGCYSTERNSLYIPWNYKLQICAYLDQHSGQVASATASSSRIGQLSNAFSVSYFRLSTKYILYFFFLTMYHIKDNIACVV